jgi:lantibiotic biosynthesis protein
VSAVPRPRGRLYQALDRFVVRAPLLPIESVARTGPPEPRAALAVAVAAPNLAAVSVASGSGPRRAERRRRAHLRYLIRMATRPTPFGLFAGVGLGSWGSRTDLTLDGSPRPVAVRPDMGWLLGLLDELERRPDVRAQLRVVANTCVLRRDGRVYLADPATAGMADEADVSVRETAAVRTLFEMARRPVLWRDLEEVLQARLGATRQQVRRLLDDLWSRGFLLTDLTPPLTGDPLAHVTDRLTGVPGAAGALRDLTGLLEAVGRLERTAAEATAPGADAGAHAAAAEALTEVRARARSLHLPQAADGAAMEFVQVDSGLALAGEQLSPRVAREAIRAAELLLRLHPAPGGPPALAAYRAAFVARFGHERLVPLTELLDPRFGLGPPVEHVHSGQTPAAGRSQREELLVDLACVSLREGAREVELDPERLEVLSLWRPTPDRVPASVDFSAFVVADCAAAVDRGDFRLVVGPNLGAQAAGRGLGRFAPIMGPPATALLADLAAREERACPEALHAELVYRPRNARSANVAVRPAIRRHEITVGASAGVPADAVLQVDELAVGVAGGRFRLWWLPRGVEVIVCSGHMLNSWTAPAIGRLLADLSLDGLTPLSPFDWGPAASLPYLPRVRVGRVVLRVAEWRQRRSGVARALAVDDERRFGDALRRWRERWAIPRHVYLAAGDNRLLLDLDDVDHADLLRAEVGRDRTRYLVLQEALPGPADAWVPGPGGQYATEIVVPLVRAVPAAVTAPPATRVRTGPIVVPAAEERRRAPGSDWLYLTLYGTPASENEILAGPLRTFAADLGARGVIDGWSFLRYADPAPHLRLRLHGAPHALRDEVLPEAARWAAELVARGARTRFGVEVYERELERYGGEAGMAVAEALFAADSETVVSMLAAQAAAASAADVLDLAAVTIDDLLDTLGLAPAERRAWYRAHAGPPRTSAATYRERRDRLCALLSGDLAPLQDLAPAVTSLLPIRRARLAPLAKRLATLETAMELDVPPVVLARSYVHLHANRLLGIDPEREQLVLGLLGRTLAALSAAPAETRRPPKDAG